MEWINDYFDVDVEFVSHFLEIGCECENAPFDVSGPHKVDDAKLEEGSEEWGLAVEDDELVDIG